MILNKREKYLQIAMNSTLEDAWKTIRELPESERIIVEAGTPLIKRYGAEAIRSIKHWWGGYVVADLKTMDRGLTEVEMAQEAGASGVVALGSAPVETINVFVENCQKLGLDAMVDMMNVENPIKVMRKWKKMPQVVILHRGVDETEFNREKPIPYLQINKIRSSHEVMVAVAGGDTVREVARAIFNDADIVVVWKEFYRYSEATAQLAQDFLREIK